MIKALVFDAYGTLFDVHSVNNACEKLFPGKGDQISQTWRKKQLEYFFLRQLMERYEPFSNITKDALHYACKEYGEELSSAQETDLMDSYLHLKLFPEVEQVLEKFDNKKLVIFSNGSEDMLYPLVEQSKIASNIDLTISANEIRHYKPTPEAYSHAIEVLDLKKEEVQFMSSNTWDIIGATSFGFKTSWINRNNLPNEKLDIQPDEVHKDLTGILQVK